MQIIEVKFKNGVFVPLEPVEMTDDQEAVVIFGAKRQKPVSGGIDYKKLAREYFLANFPGLGVEETVLELVGSAPQLKMVLVKDVAAVANCRKTEQVVSRFSHCQYS